MSSRACVLAAENTGTSNDEPLDVLDADGASTGLSRPRCEVHRDGSWHRTAHVWVLSRARREVLLQLRSATKDTFPGCWDVSAAGHVRAGDKSPEAARRELQEELGLSGGELGFLFTVRAVAIGETPMHGPYVDREFQDVYLFAPTLPGNSEKDVSIEDICIQKEEVDEVRYWNVDEYEQAIRLEDPKFVPLGDEYSQLLFEFFKRYFANVENP